MRVDQRQRHLTALLAHFEDLWRPQPFREARPAWCDRLPELAAHLLALPAEEAEHLASDGEAARELLARHRPEVAELGALTELAAASGPSPEGLGPHWAWEIPGRKRRQIEAFAAAARASGQPVIDWCGGKGHLGRLLALHWQVDATSLEIDPVLCAEGRDLARRAKIEHRFEVGDALAADHLLADDRHLVALHACGDLHRHAVRAGAARRVPAFDIAPCCYYRGVTAPYVPLASGPGLDLRRDDLRLAVTETVTASPRLARDRDRAMAWKLGFDALRRELEGDRYRSFKPVKGDWLRADFPVFCRRMAERESLALPVERGLAAFEAVGWQRQREVLRLSIVRHVFRRPLEIWLVGDLAGHLQEAGYDVRLATFCPRQLTPRNLLLSARL